MLKITEEDRKRIKSRIAGHKKYDKKRWGTSVGTISYEEYLEKFIAQEGLCSLTSLPMNLDSLNPEGASLDRINNDEPHTAENTILVHRALNLGRNDTTLEDWCRYLQMLGILNEEWTNFLAVIDAE